MQNIRIRNMSLADLDQVMVMEKLCFTLPWPRGAFEGELTQNGMARYLVAEIDGQIAGYAGIWLIFDEGHITNIAVHPDFQRHGVASALLQRVLSNAKACGIESCTLEVRRSNLPAQKLYEKYGFLPEGVRKGYYTDTKEDALLYWKRSMSEIAETYDWIIVEEEEEEHGEQ